MPNRSAVSDRRRRLSIRRVALAAPLLLSGCDWAVLNPKGFVGLSDVTILIDSVAIMLAIVVPTIIATLAFAWWFRASNTRARYLPDLRLFRPHRDGRLGDPLLVIMFLGGVDLDRLARARSRPSRCPRQPAARGAGRLARLEMAVHLPGPGRREREQLSSRPACRSISR